MNMIIWLVLGGLAWWVLKAGAAALPAAPRGPHVLPTFPRAERAAAMSAFLNALGPHVVDRNGNQNPVDLAAVARGVVGQPVAVAESALRSIQGASYRISGPNTMQTADYDRNRVSLFVEDGIVTGAGIG